MSERQSNTCRRQRVYEFASQSKDLFDSRTPLLYLSCGLRLPSSPFIDLSLYQSHPPGKTEFPLDLIKLPIRNLLSSSPISFKGLSSGFAAHLPGEWPVLQDVIDHGHPSRKRRTQQCFLLFFLKKDRLVHSFSFCGFPEGLEQMPRRVLGESLR